MKKLILVLAAVILAVVGCNPAEKPETLPTPTVVPTPVPFYFGRWEHFATGNLLPPENTCDTWGTGVVVDVRRDWEATRLKEVDVVIEAFFSQPYPIKVEVYVYFTENHLNDPTLCDILAKLEIGNIVHFNGQVSKTFTKWTEAGVTQIVTIDSDFPYQFYVINPE